MRYADSVQHHNAEIENKTRTKYPEQYKTEKRGKRIGISAFCIYLHVSLVLSMTQSLVQKQKQQRIFRQMLNAATYVGHRVQSTEYRVAKSNVHFFTLLVSLQFTFFCSSSSALIRRTIIQI